MIYNIEHAKQLLLKILEKYPIYIKSYGVCIDPDDIEIEGDNIVINNYCKITSANFPVGNNKLPWETDDI